MADNGHLAELRRVEMPRYSSLQSDAPQAAAIFKLFRLQSVCGPTGLRFDNPGADESFMKMRNCGGPAQRILSFPEGAFRVVGRGQLPKRSATFG